MRSFHGVEREKLSTLRLCARACYSSRYLYPVSSDGEAQPLNPEVRSTGPRPTIVRDQIFALTTITNRLRLAYNGQDVDWIDTGDYPAIFFFFLNLFFNYPRLTIKRFFYLIL